MAGILSFSGSICNLLSSSSFTPNLLPHRNRSIQTLRMRTLCTAAGTKQQQQQQQQKNNNKLKVLMVNHADKSYPEISLLSIQGEQINKKKTVSFGPLIPIASCNGLFLTTMGGKLAIWNPTRKDDDEVIKTIPQSTVPRPPTLKLETTLMFGFGCDPSSNDYKVIRFVEFDCNDGMQSYWFSNFVVELYSLKTQSWKQIANPHGAYPMDYTCVYINGFCYCQMNDCVDGHFVILPFGLANENFSSPIQGPNTLLSCFELVDFEGSLGVIAFETQPFEFELWVWNNNNESWSKRGAWTIGESEFIPVGRILKNDQIFLQNSMRELVIFDFAKQKLKNLGFFAFEDYSLNMFPYADNSDAEEIAAVENK